jgi:hypothetical protein
MKLTVENELPKNRPKYLTRREMEEIIPRIQNYLLTLFPSLQAKRGDFHWIVGAITFYAPSSLRVERGRG